MAVFSALKNKKNQKMREGIEDLVTKCSEAAEKDDVNVQVKSISEKTTWPHFKVTYRVPYVTLHPPTHLALPPPISPEHYLAN